MHGTWGEFPVWFQQYGALALFIMLFLENLGLPLPGELSLLYAAYQAQVLGAFEWKWLLTAGVLGSSLGQVTGYSIGRFGHQWVERGLRRASRPHAIAVAYFERHGVWTILFARFVTGLRFLAGPLAGLYRMSWRKFVVFDFLGAVLWVTVMSAAGRLLGLHGPRLVHWIGRADLVILGIAVLAIWVAWRRLRHRWMEREMEGSHETKQSGVDGAVSSPVGQHRVDRDHRPHL